MKRIALLACTGLFAFGLAACGDKENSEPASEAAVARQTSDPAKAVEAFAAKLKENNVLEAVQFAVPPAKLDEIRADWKSKMAEETPTEEEKAEFAQNMAKFTAPNAEETLYAELEPLLVKFETEMAAQMPMMIGMGQGFAMQTIQANEELTEAQKQQATEVIGALAGWLQTAKFADRDLAKKGISIAVKSARDLNVKTLDEVRALDFDHAMGKVGIAFGGMKDILALYGFDMNQALASTKASVVSKADGAAKVSVGYTLLGKSLTTETDMIEVDGRWYGKDTVEQLVSGLAGAGEEEEEVLFEEDMHDEEEAATED